MGGHRRRVFGLVVVVLCGFFPSGSAADIKYTYTYQPPVVQTVGEGRTILVFAVADRRPAIVDDKKSPDWVGRQRGGFGNPFKVTTSDGRPLATIAGETIQRDLDATGFKVLDAGEVVPVDVGQLVASRGADRGLVVIMREFNSDTYLNIDVEWDFEATVFDREGKALKSSNEKGKQTLKGSGNRTKAANAKVPAFFYEIVHKLIVGNAEIMSALASSSP